MSLLGGEFSHPPNHPIFFFNFFKTSDLPVIVTYAKSLVTLLGQTMSIECCWIPLYHHQQERPAARGGGVWEKKEREKDNPFIDSLHISINLVFNFFFFKQFFTCLVWISMWDDVISILFVILINCKKCYKKIVWLTLLIPYKYTNNMLLIINREKLMDDLIWLRRLVYEIFLETLYRKKKIDSLKNIYIYIFPMKVVQKIS